MRIVLDTNVVMSALLWRGTPYQLLQVIRQRADFVVSGDSDLLSMSSPQGVPIVTAAHEVHTLSA